MKKSIALIAFSLAVCFSLNAQNNSAKTNCQQKIDELTSQRDSLMALYNYALTMLDSLVGTNIELTNQLKTRNDQVNQLKTQFNEILKKKNDCTSELERSKKSLSDQKVQIEKLEGELKKRKN